MSKTELCMLYDEAIKRERQSKYCIITYVHYYSITDAGALNSKLARACVVTPLSNVCRLYCVANMLPDHEQAASLHSTPALLQTNIFSPAPSTHIFLLSVAL